MIQYKTVSNTDKLVAIQEDRHKNVPLFYMMDKGTEKETISHHQNLIIENYKELSLVAKVNLLNKGISKQATPFIFRLTKQINENNEQDIYSLGAQSDASPLHSCISAYKNHQSADYRVELIRLFNDISKNIKDKQADFDIASWPATTAEDMLDEEDYCYPTVTENLKQFIYVTLGKEAQHFLDSIK